MSCTYVWLCRVVVDFFLTTTEEPRDGHTICFAGCLDFLSVRDGMFSPHTSVDGVCAAGNGLSSRGGTDLGISTCKSSRGCARGLAVHVIWHLVCLSYICFVLMFTQEGRLRPRFRLGGRQPRRAEREPLRRFRLGQIVRARVPAGRLRRQQQQVRVGFRSAGRRRVLRERAG